MRMSANVPPGGADGPLHRIGNTDVVDRSDAELAADLAEDAGRLLLAVRDEIGHGFPPALGDAGDAQANALLLRRLRQERPRDAVLSEEAHDDLTRLHADRVWIIDPLDGTREYSMPRREDWAVHVALWQRTAGPATSGGAGPATSGGAAHGTITDAAVALPALGQVHRSDTAVAPPAPRSGPIRITASSNRPPAVLWLLAERLDIEFLRIGSAGAKAMAVLRGDADAYIHAGGQWEWDSAAPAGVLQAAGLHATRLDGSPLRYNRPDPYLPDLLMCRPEIAGLLLEAMGQGG
jgi:3'(2'), 5'-bisphosphate nucleotidase